MPDDSFTCWFRSRGQISAGAVHLRFQIPSGAKVFDLHGHTLYPGLVGMHEHLFYTVPGSQTLNEFVIWGKCSKPRRDCTSPPVLRPCGLRGSIETYADLDVKTLADGGLIPGLEFDITGPYLDGSELLFPSYIISPEPQTQRTR